VGAFTRFVTAGRGRTDPSGEPKLPKGAEAALWSILEAVPDPRNHLILTRDLSGEVRITDYERAAVTARFAAPASPPPMAHLPPPPEPAIVIVDEVAPADEAVVDVREAMDPYYDLGKIAENTPLTENLFTGAE
jgi:hypothetical protein